MSKARKGRLLGSRRSSFSSSCMASNGVGWNFPLNHGGAIEGLNDAGIETFRGNVLEHLAREIIQNSLDAAADKSRTVDVHFQLDDMPLHRFPEHSTYVGSLRACFEYWDGNQKARSFFTKALHMMEQKTIPVLKISDYNTTGLTGASDDSRGNWHNLVKSTGVSNKDSGSGGSFGIGKNAPFACSQLRCVFYSTKDKFGTKAFQGVTKLASHQNKWGEETRGTGYYGVVDGNKPILGIENVDSFFHRDTVGTDVFIAGFTEPESWQVQIARSILDNFFVAIYNQKLTVVVGDIRIDASRLTSLLEKQEFTDLRAVLYLEALTSSKAYVFDDYNSFPELGPVELRVITGRRDYPKRVAMIRSTGMKIFDKGHFRTPFPFVGVLLVHGEGINDMLRLMEPPAHNNWEPDRHPDDPRKASRVRDSLYRWLNESVGSIVKQDVSEELDVEGMSHYLPDDSDEVQFGTKEMEDEGTAAVPKPVHISSRKRTRFKASGLQDDMAPGGSSGQQRGNESHRETDDPLRHGGKGSRSPGGGREQTHATRAPNLSHVRSFCVSPDVGTYKVIFEAESDGKGLLAINIVGEDRVLPAEIRRAEWSSSGEALEISGPNRIGPIKHSAGAKRAVLVTLKEPARFALEVTPVES